jgi:putative ABC transport system ATP-binding protein
MPADAASCRDLVQVYPSESGAVPALRGVDAQFPAGSITVVTGPSGAGKSTLLRLLACLERPVAGEVFIAGERTAHLRRNVRRQLVARQIGYVFQRPRDNLLDYLTAAEHLTMALRMRIGSRAGRTDRDAMLASFHLDDVASERPDQLGAGRQQLLAFAMAIAGDPAIVVADEPTAELDADAAAGLIQQLAAAAIAGRTFVLATHDPTVMAIADQHLVVRRGLLEPHELRPHSTDDRDRR